MKLLKGFPTRYQDAPEATGDAWLAHCRLALSTVDSGGIVVMYGAHGTGKTRMAWEIARKCTPKDAMVSIGGVGCISTNRASTEIYTVVILTPVVFVFGEVVPKNLFQRHADVLLLRGSLLLLATDRVFRWTGLVWLMKQLAAVVNRIINGDARTDDRLAPKWRVAHLLREALAGDDRADDRLDLIQLL